MMIASDHTPIWLSRQNTNMLEGSTPLKSPLMRLRWYRLALIGFWLAAIYIVDPRGNFALDDDWVYAAAVKHLLSTGHFRLPWSSVSLVTEALWGAIFCKLFGFSFVTLRFSSLVIGLTGILAFFEALLMLGTDELLAFMGTLCFMFTPYFFNLSFTFMTDGFYCSCFILSLLFLLRNQENGSRLDLILGMILALIATLTRQIGLCVPVAWAILKSIENPKSVKGLALAWTPVVLVAGALMAYYRILRALGEMPARYNPQAAIVAGSLHHPAILLHALMSALPEIMIYIGLYLAPVAPVLWFRAHRNLALQPRWLPFCSALWIAGITPILLTHRERIPFRGSTLENFRLGNYSDANLPTLPINVWYAVTLVGIVGASSVLYALAVGFTRTDDVVLPALAKRRLRFLLLTLVVYFVPVFLVADYLDRYILPAIPLTLLSLFLITNQGESGRLPVPKRQIYASFALLAAFALFSVLGTRDYLSYYRAAWTARRFVVSQGVAPELAFNVPNWGPAYFDGDYLNDDEMAMNGPVPHADSGYEVGTNAEPGYVIIKQYPINLTLNRREIEMFVSKRRVDIKEVR